MNVYLPIPKIPSHSEELEKFSVIGEVSSLKANDFLNFISYMAQGVILASPTTSPQNTGPLNEIQGTIYDGLALQTLLSGRVDFQNTARGIKKIQNAVTGRMKNEATLSEVAYTVFRQLSYFFAKLDGYIYAIQNFGVGKNTSLGNGIHGAGKIASLFLAVRGLLTLDEEMEKIDEGPLKSHLRKTKTAKHLIGGGSAIIGIGTLLITSTLLTAIFITLALAAAVTSIIEFVMESHLNVDKDLKEKAEKLHHPITIIVS